MVAKIAIDSRPRGDDEIGRSADRKLHRPAAAQQRGGAGVTIAGSAGDTGTPSRAARNKSSVRDPVTRESVPSARFGPPPFASIGSRTTVRQMGRVRRGRQTGRRGAATRRHPLQINRHAVRAVFGRQPALEPRQLAGRIGITPLAVRHERRVVRRRPPAPRHVAAGLPRAPAGSRSSETGAPSVARTTRIRHLSPTAG
jgi:hypothetical protein